MDSKDLRARLAQEGGEPILLPPQALTEHIEAEIDVATGAEGREREAGMKTGRQDWRVSETRDATKFDSWMAL